MRRIGWIAGGIVVALLAAFLHWSLPSRDIVRIVNTEVARRGVEVRGTGGENLPGTRDVRYISAATPAGDSVVYRNEDTGWGWPPYFKFNSADLAARAEDARSTREAPQWMVVTHYGWRIPLISAFPNAVSIRPAESVDEGLFPWFNLIVVVALIVGVFFVRARALRFLGGRRGV